MIDKHTGLAGLWIARMAMCVADEATFQVAMLLGNAGGASIDERARWWAGYTHEPYLFQRAAAITWQRFYASRAALVPREWLH